MSSYSLYGINFYSDALENLEKNKLKFQQIKMESMVLIAII